MDEENQTQPLLGSRRTFNEFTDRTLQRFISPSAETSIGQSRLQTQRFLTSKTGHYAVLALVVADVTCIFAGRLGVAQSLQYELLNSSL